VWHVRLREHEDALWKVGVGRPELCIGELITLVLYWRVWQVMVNPAPGLSAPQATPSLRAISKNRSARS
jgi:hypothetical protein